MKNIIRSNITKLTKIQIFTLRDIWLFLVGIIFISTTSGAIGAFMLGVRDEEFFIGGADNILIVTQPGVTTPFTGKVPESMQRDIQKIKGVISISPETLGITIAQNLNDKSIVVRGITSNFSKLTPTNVTAGSWFNPAFSQIDNPHTNDTQLNGAMVGYLLASGLGLSCGDKIQLASTLTDMVVEVLITGIIQSNSPCDEEILVSLDLGKTITDKEYSFVSILRVLIDEEIISKETLSDIINTEFTVPISLNSRDPKLARKLIGTPIVAYTSFGELVETQIIDSQNKTEFSLRFGTYEFVATPIGAPNSQPLKIFVNQSFLNPFEIIIGGYYYNLQLNVSYNKQPVFNASVLLINRFNPRELNFSHTNEEGFTQFLNTPENFYFVKVNYKGIERLTEIRLNQSMQLNIELECSLNLIISNISSGLQVDGGVVRILRKVNLTNVVYYYNDNFQSGTTIYLDRGNYQVEFQYNNLVRKFSAFINQSTYKILYIGPASLKVWVRGENEQALESANLTIIRYDGEVFKALTKTDGIVDFQLEVGLDYDVIAIPIENQSRIYKQSIFFVSTSTLIINFLKSYQLDIVAYNGTLGDVSNNVLSDCNIVILKESNTVSSGKTDSSGHLSISLSEPGIYQVLAEKDGFTQTKSLKIDFKNQNCVIKLGKVRLMVSTQSVTGYPVSEAIISVKNRETEITYRGTSNSSGLAELFFPIGINYSLSISKGEFLLEQNLSYVESTYASIKRLIEFTGTISISLTNQFYQKIPQAYVELVNEYYDIEYMEFTNNNGEAVFYEIPWGNCSIHIVYNEQTFPSQPLDFAVDETNLEIQIETMNPNEEIGSYVNKRKLGTFSVVLSSEYVSGFLQSSLRIFTTTFTSLVIIVSSLSLLSIASVISHPIVSNEKTLKTFQQLGATRDQIIFGVVVHLTLLGLIASVLGAYLGMWIMTVFPTLRNVNIGGVIIGPKMDIGLILLIVFSNLVVITIKAGQKTRELCNMR